MSECNELNMSAGYGWTKTRPTKDGYYWHKDEDDRILILEWENGEAWECGGDVPWVYGSEGLRQELADGWWWPKEITFHNPPITEPAQNK